jgi:hypothetical protein
MSPIASFLLAKFTVLGFELQNWMVVAAIVVLLYGLCHWLMTRHQKAG